VLLLTGQYFHAFDAKSRLTIPAKLREQINRSEDCYAFMACYGFDGVLYLYTPKTYETVAPQFKPSLRTLQAVRDYERVTYAMAERLDLDRLGRILIPEYTRQQLGLSKEVAIIGVRDHIEIWDRDAWQSFVQDSLKKHDQLAERAMAAADVGAAGRAESPAASEPPAGGTG
jgi:MraZ protein